MKRPSRIQPLIEKAEQGDAAAQDSLGLRYSKGEGVSKDEKKPSNGSARLPSRDMPALKLTSARAISTDKESPRIRWKLSNGSARPQSKEMREAQFNLGYLLLCNGQGVPRISGSSQMVS